SEAGKLLDRMDGPGTHLNPRMRLARAELRLESGQCPGAHADFSVVLSDAQDELAERALYGRATALTCMGNRGAARADLESYLARFPSGRFNERARQALAR